MKGDKIDPIFRGMKLTYIDIGFKLKSTMYNSRKIDCDILYTDRGEVSGVNINKDIVNGRVSLLIKKYKLIRGR